MVIGLFVRHYKVYQGVNYIPICDDYNTKFTSFIGDNGVGKSSTLEALNTFFNNGYWNVTKNTKKSQAFIAPVFFIKKDRLINKIGNNQELKNMLEFLSDYFWEVNSEANGNLSKQEYENFFRQRDKLKNDINWEEYYLLLMGIKYENKSKVTFITFEGDLESGMPAELLKFDKDTILELIKEYYKYIYTSSNIQCRYIKN